MTNKSKIFSIFLLFFKDQNIQHPTHKKTKANAEHGIEQCKATYTGFQEASYMEAVRVRMCVMVCKEQNKPDQQTTLISKESLSEYKHNTFLLLFSS